MNRCICANHTKSVPQILTIAPHASQRLILDARYNAAALYAKEQMNSNHLHDHWYRRRLAAFQYTLTLEKTLSIWYAFSKKRRLFPVSSVALLQTMPPLPVGVLHACNIRLSTVRALICLCEFGERCLFLNTFWFQCWYLPLTVAGLGFGPSCCCAYSPFLGEE